MIRISFLMAFVLLSGFVSAQEATEEFHQKIRGAIMMGNSHMPKATEGGNHVAIIPVWGFDVDYYFHKRWSVAIQGDVKLQSFEVENDNVVVERSYPFAVATVIHYHALRHWSFFAGPGIELEKHENFYLGKIGTEYSFEITDNFEIALNFAYENKQEVYDGWTFGIAFNKKLWERKEK
jgi:hypothetical protein